MATEVTLPALGESVTEGTVPQWFKAVGDTVEIDEPLLEVSTDKVDTEVPSPVAGVLLEIRVGEDETAKVGAAPRFRDADRAQTRNAARGWPNGVGQRQLECTDSQAGHPHCGCQRDCSACRY